MKPIYKRVLLKLSGEALKGDRPAGYDPLSLRKIAERLTAMMQSGIQLGIVVGAGNLWRGRQGQEMDRVTADQMGMLATVMNALALKDAFIAAGTPALVQSAFQVESFAPLFDRDRAIAALEAGTVVIFAGGVGHPFFSTDSGAALRAVEINCDALLKATKVNGVYSADPMKDPNATRFSKLTFDEALEKHLNVMDAAAFSICRDNQLSVLVFDFAEPDALEKLLCGDTQHGTVLCC